VTWTTKWSIFLETRLLSKAILVGKGIIQKPRHCLVKDASKGGFAEKAWERESGCGGTGGEGGGEDVFDHRRRADKRTRKVRYRAAAAANHLYKLGRGDGGKGGKGASVALRGGGGDRANAGKNKPVGPKKERVRWDAHDGQRKNSKPRIKLEGEEAAGK